MKVQHMTKGKECTVYIYNYYSVGADDIKIFEVIIFVIENELVHTDLEDIFET
jgi:hypothetical protein